MESTSKLHNPNEWLYEMCEPDAVLTPYSPRIYRYLAKYFELKQQRPRGVVKREGMCPYCPLQVADGRHRCFYDLNTSDYAVHLMYHHGIFTTGSFCLEPTVHKLAKEYKTKTKKIRLVESVQCPYDSCGSVIKINSKQAGSKLISAYLRHVRNKHIDRRNHRRQKM
ncbi:unnamed protein product [Ambrosiozyma monospora]|uniref:Unnamed protein product n=1 Tax=Ambrosiozyma monospora TaxID=43982 RepID=A0ACB5U657_AMBMO|nr:unnamed protein product [Ambrosiozyma monospora]